MDIPILKYIDVLIGFALVMILASTVVTSITQLLATLVRSRGRFLREGLEALLTQVDSTNLEPKAREISEAVLRHSMIGKPNWLASAVNAVRKFFGKAESKLPAVSLGGVVKREELVRVLLELAAGSQPVAESLRKAFGLSAAGDAEAVLKAIEAAALTLESDNPKEASHVRETQALVAGIAAAGGTANAAAARVVAWFDQTMERVTHAYAFNAKVVTAAVSLGLVVVLQLDSLDLLRRLSTDDKMRAALVQQAGDYEKKIEQSKTQQTPTATAAAPADDIALLKKQKDDVEASLADLSQPSLGILTQFYRARTQPAAAPPSSRFLFGVGTKTYRLTRTQNEGFWELARQIDALDAGVKACVCTYPKSQYCLSIRSVVPNVKTLELRADPDGVNLLGPVESYYSWANLWKARIGILLSWMLLSLGSPFWYDMLKNLLQLRPLLARQEEKDRAERQSAQ